MASPRGFDARGPSSPLQEQAMRVRSPQGTVRARHEARGAVQLSRRPVRVGHVTVVGHKPRILVYARSGNARWRDAFARECARLGLDAVEVQSWGWTTCYDVCGSEEALSELTWSPCVDRWEYALNVRGR